MEKPFSPLELVLRVDAVLRRARPAVETVIERGDLRIDLEARRVTRGGREVRLTRTEFNLLAELASRAGEALTRDTLLRNVWGPSYREETRYVKV